MICLCAKMKPHVLVGLFLVDILCNFEVKSIVRLMQRRLASPCDQDFQRRHLHPTRRSCRALQHRRSSIPSLLLWVFLWAFWTLFDERFEIDAPVEKRIQKGTDGSNTDSGQPRQPEFATRLVLIHPRCAAGSAAMADTFDS